MRFRRLLGRIALRGLGGEGRRLGNVLLGASFVRLACLGRGLRSSERLLRLILRLVLEAQDLYLLRISPINLKLSILLSLPKRRDFLQTPTWFKFLVFNLLNNRLNNSSLQLQEENLQPLLSSGDHLQHLLNNDLSLPLGPNWD